ncbi:MAG TPA: hypothetical protein VGR78_00580 [Verrucomicrobiae bacterium]|jgi:hypothetical protein|nr:hypothetical protein [Verrucomicrobiae bacterium]
MKTPRFQLLLALLIGLTAIRTRGVQDVSSETRPPQYVIGLSPFLDNSVKDDVYRRIIGFVLEDLPVNSSLALYDAYNLRTIAQIQVPDVRAFRSAKTRANQFKEPIHKLKDFLAANHEKPETKLNMKDAVHLPQFMDFVGQNLLGSNRSTTVILLGSPLYIDPKEPGFSMVDGYFPSDGHILANREQSVFGLKDRPTALVGVMVHCGYFGDPWVSELHKEKITRFWALYLQEQGAHLGAFSGDLATIFNAAHLNGAELREKGYALDRSRSKVEMLRISRDVGVADWITRELSPNHQQPPPSTTIGPMKIGIRWKGNIDLDLYAAARPGAEALFFEHTRCPEGYYFKDHRSSPEREYEFIEFETPVDIWKVEANVNFFEGRAPGGPSGEIRIEFDGRIYTGSFQIAAEHGNEGRSGSRHRDCWAHLDVPAILKLSPQRDAALR